MMTYQEAFSSSSYDLELEKIKSKIQKLYHDLVVKTFKQSKPAATVDEINNFLEDNKLEFKGEGFNEESEGLENLLDSLIQSENLDDVSDRIYEKPEVATGKELKSRRHNPLWTPSTKPLESPKGGLFTPSDKQSRPKTKALEVPKGFKRQKAVSDNPKVNSKSLQAVWDVERNRLLKLVKERNKEFGIRL
jgi:hypothetical protein